MRRCSLTLLVLLIALAAATPAGATDPVQRQTLAYVQPNGRSPWTVFTGAVGAAPVKVATGYSASVSPRGDLVAYATGPNARSTLVIAPVGGRGRSILVKNAVSQAPAWSPDQRHIAVLVGSPGSPTFKRSLVDIDIATGRRVTLDKGYIGGVVGSSGTLSYSPDGTRVAYAKASSPYWSDDGGDVFVVRRRGARATAPRNLTRDEYSVSPLWGPRGIVFTHLRKPRQLGDVLKANLQVIRPDGRDRRALTNRTFPPDVRGFRAVAQSADGERLLVQYEGVETVEAWTYDFATGQARDLTGAGDNVGGYGISPDGTTVLAGSDFTQPTQDIVTYAFDGTDRRLLVENAFGASWAGY